MHTEHSGRDPYRRAARASRKYSRHAAPAPPFADNSRPRPEWDRGRSVAVPLPLLPESLAWYKDLVRYLRFIGAVLTRPGQMGTVMPSQRFLVARMIAPIPESYQGQILELGAGSGALTMKLAARCPRARILACEINPALARDTRSHLADAGLLGRVDVVPESAEHLLAELDRNGTEKADYVISGIPLGNLPGEQTLALIDSIWRALAPGGLYVQFQYSLIDRKKVKARFSSLRTVPVFLNFPPAVVYYARR